MHDQMGVGNGRMDRHDAVHGQDVTCGRAGELVSAMAGANGDGQGVHPGLGHKVLGLQRVGQHLLVAEFALGAHTVFFARLAGLQRAQAAQFALHRHAHGVRHFAHLLGHAHVVLVAGRCLGIGHERAIHHHTRKARANGLLALCGGGTVVLMQNHRNVGVRLDSGQHQVAQIGLARVFARTGRSLQDDRAVGGLCGLHDGLHLFEVVDVECGHAVAEFGGVVENLAQ